MSAKREDEILTLQDFQGGLARNLSLHSFYHLNKQVTSSFRPISITPDDFNEFRVNSKVRHLGEQHGDYADPDFI